MAHIIIWQRRVVVIVGVLGRCSVFFSYWRWVPFFFVSEWLIDFVNALGDQWFLSDKWPLWSSLSRIIYRGCVHTCACWSIVTFSFLWCVLAERDFSLFPPKPLQIYKHFCVAATLIDSWIPVSWINFSSRLVHIHSYEQAFSLRLSRLYDGIAGIPGAKWTGTATLLNAR